MAGSQDLAIEAGSACETQPAGAEHEDILPPHLTDGEHLVAWKAASRLGSTVTTYRYTGDVP
jgi:hypothetical protein